MAVSTGGEFFSVEGKPNFDRFATWWSSHANGKTIFYKLKEHLESHQKIWQGLRKAQQSLVATREQRKPNRDRVRSATHVSHVLPAASRKNPGVLPSIPSPPAPVDADLPDFSDPPQGFISDQTEDNSGFTQELAAYDYSDIMPAASTSQQIQSMGSMHAPEFPPMQWNFPPYWNPAPQWNPPPQWEAPVQAPLRTNAVAGPSFITYQIRQIFEISIFFLIRELFEDFPGTESNLNMVLEDAHSLIAISKRKEFDGTCHLLPPVSTEISHIYIVQPWSLSKSEITGPLEIEGSNPGKVAFRRVLVGITNLGRVPHCSAFAVRA
ncbi:hypothetical protein B0H11DRAFT_2199427 [Mycena galericulata]|nr:hypothetical protein B0H11DRAFT_2199427 [Mycena galericulata]